jgi:putative DNA methylase
MVESGIDPSLGRAVITYVAFILDKIVERSSSVGIWDSTTEKIQRPVSEGKLPMTWDFAESNPFGGGSGSWRQSAKDITGSLKALVADGFKQVNVTRGSAMELPYDDSFFDAVVTDPPYYDNVPYSYLADFFHVWIRRSIGHLYPEHFASTTSPVKAEAVMDPSRHSGNKNAAKEAYESMMARSFAEARRVLKPEAPLICVYAHKTTAGWGTLVEALRKTGFVVTEAWPMDTENPARQRSKESAALATSIFLVARKRETNQKGLYEEVRRDLDTTVRERVGSLWELGISGADLVIACVGAGLHAFTKYATVEYANGEDGPAAKFLAEVEATVLDTILDRLSKQVGGNGGRYSLAGLDAATRFYVLWRYTYKATELDAGEAIVFANGTHVELDGPEGLSAGARTLVEKKKGTYKLRDFSERGDNERLGLPSEHGQASPLVDVLHRILWLMEHHPSEVPVFLRAADPNTEQLRLVAQALSGPALKGGELGEVASGSELAALTKLTANWRSVVEDAAETAVGPLFRATQKNK